MSPVFYNCFHILFEQRCINFLVNENLQLLGFQVICSEMLTSFHRKFSGYVIFSNPYWKNREKAGVFFSVGKCIAFKDKQILMCGAFFCLVVWFCFVSKKYNQAWLFACWQLWFCPLGKTLIHFSFAHSDEGLISHCHVTLNSMFMSQ